MTPINIKTIALSALLLGCTIGVFAQEATDSIQMIDTGVLYIDPLFEYPTAPEEISDFTGKCDWLAENFWNPLDIKSKEAVDQTKLNHAFHVYASTIQYANKDKATLAIDRLLKNLQKNPMLLYQITKAAEETIYGPRAEFWIDELYARILTSALSNKNFPKSKRARYEHQLKQLEGSVIGSVPASFDFIRPDGETAKYYPMSTPTIILFGDPDCDECRMGKLRMQSNVAFSKAVADGKVNILFIIPDADEGWEARVTDFPKSWTVGASEEVADLYDMREIPEIYVVDSDRKIAFKHVTPVQAMEGVMSLINRSGN